MPDDSENSKISLSRRKLLAGTGAIGASGLATGLGSQAFFNDSEQFGNNQLVAGELDMKVGWEEHYSDWSEDEAEHAHMEDGDLVVDDREGYMNATLQEQFPDKETKKLLDQEVADPCEVLADVPDDLEKPVIDLSDVKPGDSGEVTFMFTLCDNPGFIWITGELLENQEQSVNEPEVSASNENNGVELDQEQVDQKFGNPDNQGELAKSIRTKLWYDENCNNISDEEGQKVIFKGSLEETLSVLSQGKGIPLDGAQSTEYAEVIPCRNIHLPALGDSENRDCYFAESKTHCVGFEWRLPIGHQNQVQTDSVKFDLGFSTEQCRHNDGFALPFTLPSEDNIAHPDPPEFKFVVSGIDSSSLETISNSQTTLLQKNPFDSSPSSFSLRNFTLIEGSGIFIPGSPLPKTRIVLGSYSPPASDMVIDAVNLPSTLPDNKLLIGQIERDPAPARTALENPDVGISDVREIVKNAGMGFADDRDNSLFFHQLMSTEIYSSTVPTVNSSVWLSAIIDTQTNEAKIFFTSTSQPDILLSPFITEVPVELPICLIDLNDVAFLMSLTSIVLSLASLFGTLFALATIVGWTVVLALMAVLLAYISVIMTIISKARSRGDLSKKEEKELKERVRSLETRIKNLKKKAKKAHNNNKKGVPEDEEKNMREIKQDYDKILEDLKEKLDDQDLKNKVEKVKEKINEHVEKLEEETRKRPIDDPFQGK